jgi:hypothetical protein
VVQSQSVAVMLCVSVILIQKEWRTFGARGAEKMRHGETLFVPLYLRASFAKGKTSTEPSAAPARECYKYPRHPQA